MSEICTQVKMCECDRCKNGTPVEYGKCHCHCGQFTSIITKTNKAQGRIKGMPSTWIAGHTFKSISPHVAARIIVGRPSNEKIKELYLQGNSTVEIAAIVSEIVGRKVSTDAVGYWLEKAGIQLRDMASAKRISNRKRLSFWRGHMKQVQRKSVAHRKENPIQISDKSLRSLPKARRAFQKKCSDARTIITCKCGNQRSLKPSEINPNGNYCSLKCAAQSIGEKLRKLPPLVKCANSECGKIFESDNWSVKNGRACCSISCGYKARSYYKRLGVPVPVQVLNRKTDIERSSWLTDEEWSRLTEGASA